MFKRIPIPVLAALLVVAGATSALAAIGHGDPSFQIARHDKNQGERGGFLGGELAKQLNLTADQQARIKAIKAKYHKDHQPRERTGNDFGNRLKTLLQAPNVDQGALRTLLSEKHAGPAQMTDTFIPMLGEIRGVLTAEQREKWATLDAGKGFMGMGGKRGHGGPGGPGMMGGGRMFGELKLTPAQQQAADDLKAQMKNGREAMKSQHEKTKGAFANFIRNGDQGALRSALQGNHPAPPVDALVKFYASLDQSQRAQLVAHMGKDGDRQSRHNRRGHRRQNQTDET